MKLGRGWARSGSRGFLLPWPVGWLRLERPFVEIVEFLFSSSLKKGTFSLETSLRSC